MCCPHFCLFFFHQIFCSEPEPRRETGPDRTGPGDAVPAAGPEVPPSGSTCWSCWEHWERRPGRRGRGLAGGPPAASRSILQTGPDRNRPGRNRPPWPGSAEPGDPAASWSGPGQIRTASLPAAGRETQRPAMRSGTSGAVGRPAAASSSRAPQHHCSPAGQSRPHTLLSQSQPGSQHGAASEGGGAAGFPLRHPLLPPAAAAARTQANTTVSIQNQNQNLTPGRLQPISCMSVTLTE